MKPLQQIKLPAAFTGRFARNAMTVSLLFLSRPLISLGCQRFAEVE
jgi:hypothetical protein